MRNNRDVQKIGEDAAAALLQKEGWTVLHRNWSLRLGELDLVVRRGSCLVFVEVRSTGTDDATRPAASVDHVKQRRLTDLALHFLKEHHLLNHPARFDVLALSWPEGQRRPTVAHYRNAFEAVGRFQMYS